MFRAILFDLDACLAPANKVGEELYAPAFDAIRRANPGTVSEETLTRAFADCWRHPLDWVAERHGFTPEMRAAGWREFITLETHRPMRGYGDLDALATLPVRMFLVTSGFRRLQTSKVRALGLARWMEAIYIDAIDEPDRVGKAKLFECILATHQLAPAETLVVGDNPEAEIAAGNRLGMPTVQILRPGVPRGGNATHEIRSLHELRPLLGLPADPGAPVPASAPPPADPCAATVRTFDEHAERYRDKYMELTLYAESYRAFCDRLPPGRVRVLDAACGPGNAARALLQLRPELDLLGIDLAPRMVDLARAAVPTGRFAVHDCRRVAGLGLRFHGILCGFGLPYLSDAEGRAFVAEAAAALEPGGVLYLSLMLGARSESECVRYGTENEVHLHIRPEAVVRAWLEAAGLTPVWNQHLPSPANASRATNDWVVIARRDAGEGEGGGGGTDPGPAASSGG